MWFVHFDPDDWDEEYDEETLPGITVKNHLQKKFDLPDGSFAMECSKCHHHVRWAEPNQPDGTFKCYECKMVW